MCLPIEYKAVGRTQQKRRTHSALLAAARELVAHGVTPTVEDAAVAASVSRTTAYRYFPNQHALLAAAYPVMLARSLLPEDGPAGAAERLDLVIEAFTRLVVDTEPQLRTMLRLSLDPSSARDRPLLLRQGRAIGWIDEALSPLRTRVSEPTLRRLVLAIRSVTGIEALIWLTDVAGLSREDAVELMRWSARALFQSAVASDIATSR
ncbi:MAG: TetR/AcrR family transcriptional regulator [Chloroflexota bacterium]|nr:TetR/AcrR family transcriptional regulator [Chloroflexota bacterium]